MDRLLFSRLIACFLFIIPCVFAYAAEENFLLINGATNEVVLELGPHINERVTPACSFNIVLSLMGYDAGILKDENTPSWHFQAGYADDYESWKAPQTPQSWMKYSAFWYSQLLASHLGLEKMQNYLTSVEYGNHDMSGGVKNAWVSSSLKISPKEQVDFIHRMILGKLPISSHAIQMTKVLLWRDELPAGWKLFGKTGKGSIRDQDGHTLEVVWFVGWVEKDQTFFPFAYNIRDRKIPSGHSIPRVKQLLADSNILQD